MAALTSTEVRDDIEAFTSACIRARATFVHCEILYGAGDTRLELLDDIAPMFFRDLNAIFIDSLILQICKLTDPEESQGRKNLTISFLINNLDFSGLPSQRDRLLIINARIGAFRRQLAPARNKLIGHNDRASITANKPLGGAPMDAWKEFWIDLQEIVFFLRKHFLGSDHFYLNAIGMISDADQLVKALKASTYFETMLANSATARRCSDTAFASKVFDA